eukprot:9014-Heterococcus_DN1.PRE.4
MHVDLTTRVALPWSRDLAWVKKELTIISKPASAIAKPMKLEMFEVVQDKIYLPKSWALTNKDKLGITSITDKQHVGHSVDPQDMQLTLPHGLRPHQQLALDAVVKAFHAEEMGGGALLCLPCGYGKSVASLVISHHMAVKTLIIVNTAILASQWKNVIAQYIPNARVGMIQQAKFEIENKTHVIAVAHTVAGGRYNFGEAGFQLLIIDEVHRICCPTLSKCITIAGCRWRLGLTATPIRPDGFDGFLKHAIGDIAFQMIKTTRR